MPVIKYETSRWTYADTTKIAVDSPTTTIPDVPYDFPRIVDNIALWDSFLLQNRDGQKTKVNGWTILFCLCIELNNTQSFDDQWHSRNDSAFLGALGSKDGGLSWQYLGRVLSKSCDIRPHEWSGNVIMLEDGTNNAIVLFTSVDDKEQVPCQVFGKIRTTKDSVYFDDFNEAVELVKPDGINSATIIQNPYAAFRDPNLFQNHLLVETDLAIPRGTKQPTAEDIGILPPDFNFTGREPSPYATASIGVWSIENGELVPQVPILSAFGACGQTEMPRVIKIGNLYYLFTITHKGMFPHDYGVDGLYGFYSDKPFSGYKPMNGSGLLLGNSSKQPAGAYAFNIYYDSGRLFVHSFIDTVPNPNGDGTYRIGGTLNRTVELVIDGSTSFVKGVLGYGELPVSRNYTC